MEVRFKADKTTDMGITSVQIIISNEYPRSDIAFSERKIRMTVNDGRNEHLYLDTVDLLKSLLAMGYSLK